MTRLALADLLIVAIFGQCVFCERSTHFTMIVPMSMQLIQHGTRPGLKDMEFPMIVVGVHGAFYCWLPSADLLKTPESLRE